ncbi:hypothetical protein BJX99DRAFT_154618 [Aspergillus californicus]
MNLLLCIVRWLSQGHLQRHPSAFTGLNSSSDREMGKAFSQSLKLRLITRRHLSASLSNDKPGVRWALRHRLLSTQLVLHLRRLTLLGNFRNNPSSISERYRLT